MTYVTSNPTSGTQNRFTVQFFDGETISVRLPYGSSRSEAVDKASEYRPRNENRSVTLVSGELPKLVADVLS